MAKTNLAGRDGRSGKFIPVSIVKNELQTFTVRSSRTGLDLARNPHSSERDRVTYSEQFVEDSLKHATKRLDSLKKK